ncbi:MAG: hypothetical protein C0627_03435 [Sulfurimonas sp.]|nr:MAG: hypothetical protein C0627_03435 [Sulfurimonas sp.]
MEHYFTECFLLIDKIYIDFYNWAKNSIFYYQFFLSIVSAIIFWLVFSHIPESKKYKSLRPIVELDMYQIYSSLFHLFDLIMRYKDASPSFFQEKIRGGTLSRNDIKLGLQNKCLNASYLFDPKISHLLMPIGEQIFESSKKIEQLIDKIFSFNQFSSPIELLLLEKIRQELKKYDYDERRIKENAVSVTGFPSVPVIYYREENFYDLYKLFIELQDIVLNRNNYFDRNIFIFKIQYLFYSGQYQQCINHINKNRNYFSEDINFSQNYYALCQYQIDNKKEFYKTIDNIYKERPYNGSLVSSRSFLKDFTEDEKLINILKKYYTEEEYEYFKVTIEQEKEHFDLFMNTNRSLSKYHANKDFRLIPIEDGENKL